MFIDYVTLMLLNMSAGLTILALFLLCGMDEVDQNRWAPPFAICGVIALLNGFHMIWHWPLPGSYNSLFGELTIMWGGLFAAAAFALYKDIDLQIIAVYAFFAGLASIVGGYAVIYLGMTKAPLLSGAGFILTGLGGIFAFPTLYFRGRKELRYIGAFTMLLSAAIWALTGYMALWGHIISFAKYVPPIMK